MKLLYAIAFCAAIGLNLILITPHLMDWVIYPTWLLFMIYGICGAMHVVIYNYLIKKVKK